MGKSCNSCGQVKDDMEPRKKPGMKKISSGMDASSSIRTDK